MFYVSDSDQVQIKMEDIHGMGRTLLGLYRVKGIRADQNNIGVRLTMKNIHSRYGIGAVPSLT